MKTKIVTIEVTKIINDQLEIQPNEYVVKEDGELVT